MGWSNNLEGTYKNGKAFDENRNCRIRPAACGRKHICMVVLLCTVYGSGEWHGGCHGGGLGSGSSTIDINVSGLRPGDKKTYIFEVTNTENGVTSEVGQDYSIIVETTGNLPLDFALTYDNSNPDHQGLFVNTGENGTLTFNGGMAAVRGGRLPHSVSAIHTYTLAVSWPEDKAGTEYTDEIDLVTLTVSSEQTVPAIQE